MVIYFHRAGRLANRLFAASHLIANAEEYRYKLLLLSLSEYASSYEGERGGFWAKRFAYFLYAAIFKVLVKLRFKSSFLHQIIIAEIPEYSFGEPISYSWDGRSSYDLNQQDYLRIVRSKPIIILFGRFFRDYEGVHKHQDIIRERFTPNQNIASNLRKTTDTLRAEQCTLVGVHIRKGDYATFQNGKYNYTINQYVDLLNRLGSSFKNEDIIYLICSNETILSKSLCKLKFKHILSEGSPEEDLHFLSLSDYIVGPPSTYSLWASFYGKVPIYHIRDISKEIEKHDFAFPRPEEAYNFIFT